MQQVGSRGRLLELSVGDFKVFVYFIVGEERIYVCDTGCGPDDMVPIVGFLRQEGLTTRPITVFNSHYHWDHIWGNSVFKDSQIVAHEETRSIILRDGEKQLKNNRQYVKGDVAIVPPTLTFKERLWFPNDRVEFFHTPGHTEDSSSCVDQVDGVLFVGDNLESPIPQLASLELETYVDTLERYLELDARIIIAAHDGVLPDDSLLRSNLDYVRKFSTMRFDEISTDSDTYELIHISNLYNIGKMHLDEDRPSEARTHLSCASDLLVQRDSVKYKAEIESISKMLEHIDEI